MINLNSNMIYNSLDLKMKSRKTSLFLQQTPHGVQFRGGIAGPGVRKGSSVGLLK